MISALSAVGEAPERGRLSAAQRASEPYQSLWAWRPRISVRDEMRAVAVVFSAVGGPF
jgi:hypothetical protein